MVQISVNIPWEAYIALKEEGNVSKIVAELIRQYLENRAPFMLVADLEELRMRKALAQKQLKAWRDAIRETEKYLNDLEKRERELLKELEEIEKSRRIANIIKQINDVIVQTGFSLSETKKICRPLFEQLEKLGYPVTDQWLKEQIIRVERWLT